MKVPVGLSNHHIHLTREVGEILFGKGYELTFKRELMQIGEFACEETVDVVINGKVIDHVRLIGPYREYTQVELLERDCKFLDVRSVRRNSGDVENTIPFKLIGPAGSYEANYGAFVANNHIHMSESDLEEFELNAGDFVEVATKDGKVINGIYIKSDPSCTLELHLNKDEGEELGLDQGDEVTVFGKEIRSAER